MNQYLKRKRAALNLTQTEVAKQLGVTESTIQNWENGRSKPDLSNMKLISKVYKVPIAELIIERAKSIEKEMNDAEDRDLESSKHLFPDDIKWDRLDLSLSKVEQNVLFTIKIANRLGSDPMSSLCSQVKNMVELDNILDRLIDLGLLKVREIREEGSLASVCSRLVITKLGYFILNAIKSGSTTESFNINKQLSTFEAFKVLEHTESKDFVKMLVTVFKDAAFVPLDYFHSEIRNINKYLYCNKEQINNVVDFLKEKGYIEIKQVQEPTCTFSDWPSIGPKPKKDRYIAMPTDKTLEMIDLLKN